MLTRFISAFTLLGRAAGSVEFTLRKQVEYMTNSSAIVDDASDLREWAEEIVKLARIATAAEEFDMSSCLVIEANAAEFIELLDEVVVQASMLDDDDDTPYDDGFFAELDIDLDADQAEALSDSFWEIIDANFEDGESTVAEDVDVPKVAELVRELAESAFLVLNEKFQHPSLRDAAEPKQFGAIWGDDFLSALDDGALSVAQFVELLTELCDAAIFSLIAASTPVDQFAAASRSTIGQAKRLIVSA